MSVSIKFENISKQYRLGLVSTNTISHDLNRFWKMNVLRQEDPYLKIGEVNDRAHKGTSDYVWALKDINFEVEQGDVLGIIGKNGAGKSTLLKILSKVTAPTTGSIKARGRIASLLEVGTGFHPEMTGRENIYMNGAIMGMTKAEITRKLDEIVDFSGVERYLDTPVKRYSSGMTVRLGFAIAAHLEPEILVVDEVLAVGDAEFQKKAIGKMQDVSKGEGRTVLFVSHNMAAVSSLCNKGVLLEDGMNVFKSNINLVIENYLTSNKRFGTITKIIDFCVLESNEIFLKSLKINNSEWNLIELDFPNRKIIVDISLEIFNDLNLDVELLIYSIDEVLLAKFAPSIKNSNAIIYKAGLHNIVKEFQLPENISNGEYVLSIDIVHPKIEFLIRLPFSVRLFTRNFISKEGYEFNYSNSGFLIL